MAEDKQGQQETERERFWRLLRAGQIVRVQVHKELEPLQKVSPELLRLILR